MASIIYEVKRSGPDVPWVVWFEPYAEKVFTKEEIQAVIQPTRDGLLKLPGFRGIKVTEPNETTLIATITFDEMIQAIQARLWLSKQTVRRKLIKSKTPNSIRFKIT